MGKPKGHVATQAQRRRMSKGHTKHGWWGLKKALDTGSLDQRTRPAKLIAMIETELLANIGREPTAAERVLALSAAQKAVLEQLGFDQIFAGKMEPMRWLLTVSNSKRLDLQALRQMLTDRNEKPQLDYETYVKQLRENSEGGSGGEKS
jgi:hypothetical protein